MKKELTLGMMRLPVTADRKREQSQIFILYNHKRKSSCFDITYLPERV